MGPGDAEAGDLTSGPITPALLLVAAPLVVQNVVHVLNQLVDTLVLGRVGEPAVAAVGLTFPILAALFGVVTLTAVGTQIAVAQRVGADDPVGARRAVFNGAVLAVGLGAVLAVTVAVTAESLVGLLGAGEDVGPLAVRYLLAILPFFVFGTLSDTIENGFVGWGDSRAALRINLVIVGTNVALSPVLVLGPGPVPALGVLGAGLASGIGYTAGCFAALALARGHRGSFRFTVKSARLSATDVRTISRLGSPIAGQHLAAQSVRVAVVGIVATVGGAAGLAAYTVGARVASVAFIPATGFQQAAQSMVGQNVGAGREDRADRTIRVGVAVVGSGLAVVGAVQWLVPELLAGLFLPTATATGFDLTVDYLRILAYGYPAIGISALVLAGFNGAGHTSVSLLADVGKHWGIRLPIALLALPSTAAVSVAGLSFAPGLDLGVLAIFWAVTASNVLVAVGVGAAYLWVRDGMLADAAGASAGS